MEKSGIKMNEYIEKFKDNRQIEKVVEQAHFIRIHEVAPRDGLQDESIWVPTHTKLKFISLLTTAGLRSVEITAFVNPKKVPQMADAGKLIKKLKAIQGVEYSILIPNMRGLEDAMREKIKSAGVTTIAIFTAATEDFAESNIGMSIHKSLIEFTNVTKAAMSSGLKVRGYISTCFYDPFRHKKVKIEEVRKVADRLFEIGCNEICLADTTGDANPNDVRRLLRQIDPKNVALHFHDKNKNAIYNVEESMNCGFRSFDSSAGGLGGCPMAPKKAPGNVATEDLVKLMRRNGVTTDIDPIKLAKASLFIRSYLSNNRN